jgi:hypothetical protein
MLISPARGQPRDCMILARDPRRGYSKARKNMEDRPVRCLV